MRLFIVQYHKFGILDALEYHLIWVDIGTLEQVTDVRWLNSSNSDSRPKICKKHIGQIAETKIISCSTLCKYLSNCG